MGTLQGSLVPVPSPLMESDHENKNRTWIPGHAQAPELRSRGSSDGKMVDLEAIPWSGLEVGRDKAPSLQSGVNVSSWYSCYTHCF